MSEWVDVTDAAKRLLSRQDYYVYRAWDAEGNCLYVGVTNNLENRLLAHQSSYNRPPSLRRKARSEWISRLDRIEIMHFANRDDALDFEALEIARLTPEGNNQIPLRYEAALRRKAA